VHDDNMTLSATDLLELNRDLQGSRAIRLLAATNISLYATLMERHLSDGTLPETELVVRLERDLDDLDDLDDAQSGLALIKSWAAQGWLHRIVDERHDVRMLPACSPSVTSLILTGARSDRDYRDSRKLVYFETAFSSARAWSIWSYA
jgi:hypothetical protein